jgi:hypothetical protein
MVKQSRRNLRPSVYFTRSLRDSHRIVTKALKDVRMDIDALHSALLSFTLLSGKLRLAREKLPVTERTRSDFVQFLNELEPDLRMATALLAGELGFAICRCCWPPEVLATDLEGHVRSLAPVEKKSRSNMSASARRISAGAQPPAKPGVAKKRVNGSSSTAVTVRRNGRDRRSRRSVRPPGLAD